MSLPERHPRLLVALFLAAALLAALNLRRVALKEDVSVMVPDALAPAVSLFQSAPLAQKIFIVVGGPAPERTREAADAVAAAVGRTASLSAPDMGLETVLSLHERVTPGLWDAALESEALPLLREENVMRAMRENVRLLSGPEGIYLKPWITADPLHLMPLFGARLKALAAGSGLDSSNGYLTSPDGLRILLVFDAKGNQFEGGAALRINAMLAQTPLPEGCSAFLMGSARYTAENRRIIEADLSRIFLVSCTLLAALFLWFFRERRALLIYLIPPATVLIAATGTSLAFGGLSGITLGFSAVLLGMASDYSTYVYFALRASPEEARWRVMRKVGPTITLSALTLILAFSLLGFSQIALFRQLALFIVIGLAVEWFVAVGVAPVLFPCRARPEPAFEVRRYLSFKSAAAMALLLLAAGAAALPLVRFNFRLEALNTVSERFERDRREFENLTGHLESKNQFLFVFGKTKDEALENLEKLARAVPGRLTLPSLFVSEKTAAANRERWRGFWSPERTGTLRETIAREAQNAGLKPSAFEPFFDFLNGGRAPEGPALETLYNPFVETPDGRAAVFNILPEGTPLPALDGVPSLGLSQAGIHEALKRHVTHRIALIVAALLAGAAALLAWRLGSFRHALFCLLPGLCGIALFFIVLAVSRAECNLFGFFILPMLIGLGINYGIFIVQQQAAGADAHPTRAVVATSLSTLAGFGALVAAQHKVLFILGLGAFAGILGAIGTSVLLLPPLLRARKPSRAKAAAASKALALLLAAALLPGCAAPYRLVQPPSKPLAGTPEEHAGVYRGRLPFRALAVRTGEACRVAVLSDLGMKLVDLNVGPGGNEVYFKSLPQIAVADFVRFYAAWAPGNETPLLVRSGKTVRYCPGGKELLWITAP